MATGEQIPEFTPTPKDEEKMEEVIKEANEILGEDERGMANVLETARGILERASEEDNEKKYEAEK